MSHELVDLAAPEDWAAFHAIRRIELFEARGRFGIYNENHPDDRAVWASPLLLKFASRPIGVVRLDRWPDASMVVRLVAIIKADQGQGHGCALDALIVARARKIGVRRLMLNAINTAVGFYRATGWHEAVWDEAERTAAGPDCVQMRKLI